MTNSKNFNVRHYIFFSIVSCLLVFESLFLITYIIDTQAEIDYLQEVSFETCSVLNEQTYLTNTCIGIMNNITDSNVSYSSYYEPCKAFLP